MKNELIAMIVERFEEIGVDALQKDINIPVISSDIFTIFFYRDIIEICGGYMDSGYLFHNYSNISYDDFADIDEFVGIVLSKRFYD